MKKWCFSVVSLVTVFGACGSDTLTFENSIADYLERSEDRSKLAASLEDAKLLDDLARDGEYTLFAYSNDVFDDVVTRTQPDETEKENWATYHVVEGVYDLRRKTALRAMNGAEIHVRNTLGGLTLNNGLAIGAPIELDNGVVYEIDEALTRPLETTTTRYESKPNLQISDPELEEFRISTDTITIEEEGILHNLRVELDITHPNLSNLFVTLSNLDTGVEIHLVPQSFNNFGLANINTELADSAILDITVDASNSRDPGESAYGEAAYQPLRPLEVASGSPLAGVWRLTIYDFRQRAVGQLNAWALTTVWDDDAPDDTIVFTERTTSNTVWGKGFTEQTTTRGLKAGTPSENIRFRMDVKGEIGEEQIALEAGQRVALSFQVPSDFSENSAEIQIVAQSDSTSRISTKDVSVVQPDSDGIELLSQVPLMELGAASGSGNDIWGWTDDVTGAEVAIMGTSEGTAFVDITTPTEPRVLGHLPTHTFSSGWRDIKVYQNHAYIVSEADDHGMQVFDLTQLRSVSEPQIFDATEHVGNFGQAHNIVVNEDTGFAYVVGSYSSENCMGGLMMYDLTNPASPQFIDCFAGAVPPSKSPGPEYPTNVYIHDAQCVIYDGPDADYQGREICLTSDESTVGIVDVTDKSNPIQISRFTYPTAGYTHQGWLTTDKNYFLVNDEFDEADDVHDTRSYVFDVRDLDFPVQIGAIDNPRDAIGHNFYVEGNMLYQANYTSGLRVMNLDRVANAFALEEAYYDTYPDDDSRDGRRSGGCSSDSRGPTYRTACADKLYQGAWSNYPYFESGTIVVSDMVRGLFVLKRN